MIALKDVGMTYNSEDSERIEGLDGVSVTIEEGEFVFLIGESGAGKSTLLKAIIRDEKVSSGHVVVGDWNVGRLKLGKLHELRRTIGCVFQDFKLIPGKTVEENVGFVMEVVGEKKERAFLKVEKALNLVGMYEKRNKYPKELSGGQIQRVAIARAIVNEPKILLADEPTGNLDPENTELIFEILKEINSRGTTVLVTTHSKEIVDRERKRVIEMSRGKIIRDDAKGVYEVWS